MTDKHHISSDKPSPESDDVAIKVDNVLKVYQTYESPQDRLKQSLANWLMPSKAKHKIKYFREYTALQNASFTVRKGESVGIIGRNGAGKSTLLQILCGTLSPTSGTVTTNGRIAALLELGSGFNPEFTGKENIYLNARLHGLSTEEISEKLDKIVQFADIGDFLEQPVKTYSSGMYVRLAFGVIANVDADILVIDEALAVGDVFFQQKCMRFIKSFKANGGTIILVSHDTTAIQTICDKAILIEKHCAAQIGDIDKIFRLYLENLYQQNSQTQKQLQEDIASKKTYTPSKNYLGDPGTPATYQISQFHVDSPSFGEGKATLIDAYFQDSNRNLITEIQAGQRVEFRLTARINHDMYYPAFGFMIKNRHGEYLFTEGTDKHFLRHDLVFKKGTTATANFSFEMPTLIHGKYTVNVAIAEGIGDAHNQQHWIHDALVIHATQSRLVHGWCGTHNMSISIEIYE